MQSNARSHEGVYHEGELPLLLDNEFAWASAISENLPVKLIPPRLDLWLMIKPVWISIVAVARVEQDVYAACILILNDNDALQFFGFASDGISTL